MKFWNCLLFLAVSALFGVTVLSQTTAPGGTTGGAGAGAAAGTQPPPAAASAAPVDPATVSTAGKVATGPAGTTAADTPAALDKASVPLTAATQSATDAQVETGTPAAVSAARGVTGDGTTMAAVPAAHPTATEGATTQLDGVTTDGVSGVCDIAESARRGCGETFIQSSQCLDLGCCWRESTSNGIPWCYHSNEQILATCMLPESERQDCGWVGVTKQQCTDKNCCWMPAAGAIPWCYTRPSVLETCRLPENEREDCGWPGITIRQCVAKNCCWTPASKGIPWCYSRRTAPSAGPVAETTNAEQTTIAPQTRVDKVTAVPSAGDTEGTTVGDVADTTQAPDVTGTVGMTTGEEVAVTTAPKTDAIVSTVTDDPCVTHTLLEDDWRHFSFSSDKSNYKNDTDMVEGWYAFKYNHSWAEIPSECIKEDQCGGASALRLDMGGKSMPKQGENITDIAIVFSMPLHGSVMCEMSGKKTTANIKGCTGYHVYYLKNTLADSTYCIKLPGEKIPAEFLGSPAEETTTVEATTEPLTEEIPVSNATEVEATNETVTEESLPEFFEVRNLTDAQEKSIVTIEFKCDKNLTDEFLAEFKLKFRALVAKYLNELPPPEPEVATTEAPEVTTQPAPEPEPTTAAVTQAPATAPAATTNVKTETVATNKIFPIGVDDNTLDAGAIPPPEPADDGPEEPDSGASGKRPARVRRSTGDNYTADDVVFVGGTPQKDPHTDNLQSSNYAQQQGQDPASQERLQKAMENARDSGEMEKETGMPVVAIYPGMYQSQPPPSEAKGIWETHYGLFITIIILVVVCIIIIIIGLICLKCCQKDDEKDKVRLEEGRKQPPTVISNPIPDEEITRDEAPMVESGNPAVTPNGSGQHLRKDEDNGWVVPMDQLSQEEREHPDVENTKL